MKQNILVGLMLLALCIIPQFGWAAPRQNLTLGLVADETGGEMAEFLAMVHREINSLAGARYTFTLGGTKGGAIHWNAEEALALYQKLAADPEVDLIVSLGVVSSSVITKAGPYPKPVVAVGIIDPALQGVKKGDGNRSGVKNLTYIHFNRSILRDLTLFHKLVPFKDVGIVFDPAVTDVMKEKKGALAKAHNGKSGYRVVSSSKGVNEILEELSGVDAVYIGYMGAQEETGRPALVKVLNEMKIPTFGSSVRDVRQGMLAAAAPEGTTARMARRVALNIDGWVGGDKLSELPVNLDFKEALTVNMDTARLIGFSPSFDILSQAELLGDLQPPGVYYTLPDAVNLALVSNHDLRINTFDVKQAEEAVRKAGTSFLPDVKLVGSQVFVDEDVAATSANTQAERTTSGKAVVEQLLYSDEAFGVISSQKELLEAERHTREALVLDTVYNTTVAFTDLLKARTEETIQMENVALLKKNLSIAKQREAAGATGPGDAFSWESRLATGRAALSTARAAVNASSRNLNLIMGVPMDQETRALDTGLDAFMDASYLSSAKGQVTNPEGFEVYLRFLVDEAVKNAPELASIDRNIAAIQRRVTVLNRKNWVPTVSASGSWNRDFDRGGIGSEDSPSYHEESWNAGVNVTWPLFAKGENRVELAQERLALKQLEERKRKSVKSIELSVRVALLETITRYVNREQAVRSDEYAKKSLEIIADSYAKGRASLTDLVEAQNSSLNAGLAATNAIYEQVTALLQLERAVGEMSLVSDPSELEDFTRRAHALFAQVPETN
ncbi:cation efflux system protein [Desulfoluna limicola]|uniref:Cation efflux system protein n=1 Tax=Desulfoluna limicola TaxID=2810562 RepID=A0ABN6EYV0_9BACT|nr:ABC transporter substrate binding protein [Desulfoluna limicola]BCS94416.1 cation efflux system protein [Desulfoluna limicola]